MNARGFTAETLDAGEHEILRERARLARGDILAMTTLAGCGHPGGSMSSIDIYTTLYSCAAVHPESPGHPDRDRIVISHGHTSPGAYAALARCGFFPPDEVLLGFRRPGSMFEGHVERCVPGIEWGTGNLGQGLSAGCAFALAARILGRSFRTYVVMGDGEQQKGQIAEARRFAVKYALNDLTVLVDLNHLQISGDTSAVMPQNISENFRADGWHICEVDGHDFPQLYAAIRAAHDCTSAPTAIIARTVMGKGVSFMENVAKFHGVALSADDFARAAAELGLTIDLQDLKQRRAAHCCSSAEVRQVCVHVKPGTPVLYDGSKPVDNRSAFGAALKHIAEANCGPGSSPIAVLDCDLAGSVKTDGFQGVSPDRFFQTGIQEHHAATMAGALSVEGIVPFFADFGVFGVCETYNQHRLNDINHTNIKLVCTHVGLDVGEDGKTHQCIDYIGVLRNLFGFHVVIPADANQTDRATRYAATTPGNFFLGMGRSKLPVIMTEDGKPFFGPDYEFSYGTIDLIRDGSDAAILSCGTMLHRAVAACDQLRSEDGLEVQVLNVSCPTRLDADMLTRAARTGLLITYEDHNVHTGLGCCVADFLVAQRLSPILIKLGVTDYGQSGPPGELFASSGLGAADLAAAVREAVALSR